MGQAVTQVAGAALMIGGLFTGGVTTGIGMALMAAGVAVQVAGTFIFKPKIPSQNYRDSNEIKQMLRSASAPENVVYGKVIKSGLLAFAEEEAGEQDQGEKLNLVLVLASHPIERIGRIWLGEETIDTFGDLASWELHNGRRDADPYLLANCPSWKADMIGRDIAWLRVTLKYDAEKFPYGLPNVKAEVWGKKVLDPRTGLVAWSDNAALVILDYYRSYLSVPDRDIDMDNFRVQASLCSDSVVTPEGHAESRYTLNGSFELSESPATILDAMHRCVGGHPTYMGGKHGMMAGAYYGPPALSITESQLIDTVEITPETTLKEATNAIYGTFIDEKQDYAKTDFTPVIVQQWVDEDGLEIREDMDLRFVSTPYQAQRVANMYLRRKRAGRQVKVKMNLDGYAYRPGQVVKLNLAQLGVVDAEFRVADWSFSLLDGVDITLIEESATLYDDAIGQPFERPAFTKLPSGGPGMPINLLFTPERIGEIVQGRLSWNNITEVTYNRVLIRQNGAIIQSIQVPGESVALNGLLHGRYQAEVSAVNSIGATSAPAVLQFDIQSPPAPQNVEVIPGIFEIKLVPALGDVESYGGTFEYWFSDSKLANASASEVVSHAQRLGQGMFWTKDDLKPLHDYWFYVRSVNVYGKSVFVEASGQPKDGALEYLDAIKGKILKSHLGQELQKQIDSALTEANLKEIEQQIDAVRDQLGADAAALDKQLADASQRLDSLAKAQIETSIGLQQEKQERGEREAWIVDRQNTLESDTQSVAEDVKQLGANFDGQQATLTTLEKTVSNNEKATATSLKQLESRTETSEGAIKDLQQTVATDSEATAEQFSKLNTKVGENATGITQLKQSQSDLEGSQAQIAQGLEANTKATIQNSLNQVEGEQRQAAVSATLKTTQEVIANQQEAHAKQLTTLTANFDTASASLTRLDETVAREKEATSRALQNMGSEVDKNKSSITQEAKTRADADKTLGERITQVRSETKESLAQALDQVKTVSEAQQASGSRIQSLEASAAIDNTPEGLIEQALGLHEQGKEHRKAEAKIIHEQTIIANQQEAVAKEQTTLKAQLGENTAQLQQVSEVQADVNGKLSATWMVKVEVDANGNPVVGGVALGVDSEGNSQFLVDANRFAIINRANGQVAVPFVVQNGQMFVSSAFFADASIDAAKIKRASIGSAQIADSLTSDNFIPGTQGLMINFRTGEFQLNGNAPGIGRKVTTNLRDDFYDGGNQLVVRVGKLRD